MHELVHTQVVTASCIEFKSYCLLSTLPLQCEAQIPPEQENGSQQKSCLTPYSYKIVAHSDGKQSGKTVLDEGVKDIPHCPGHDERELANSSQAPNAKTEEAEIARISVQN